MTVIMPVNQSAGVISSQLLPSLLLHSWQKIRVRRFNAVSGLLSFLIWTSFVCTIRIARIPLVDQIIFIGLLIIKRSNTIYLLPLY